MPEIGWATWERFRERETFMGFVHDIVKRADGWTELRFGAIPPRVVGYRLS